MTYRRPARAAARSLASSAAGAPAERRTSPHRRLLAAAALVVLIGTGCANAPAATGSSGSNATGGTDGGGDQSGPTGALTPPEPQELQKRREFARCMRENGVEDFPDPDANGIFQYYGDDPDLKATGERCDDLQPADQGPR